MPGVMTTGRSAPGGLELRSRRNERAALDELLAAARAGRSEVLVLRGEAGIGKTALLGYAVESARDFRVLRVAGVESEMELPFAALHQLCASLHDWLDRLPGPQHEALATTFGLRAGTVPDRLFVGLATLSLLSEAAERRPLLCVIDDAQWLDRASAQALAFVARRLLAESVVMLFAVREPIRELAALPELVVEGLRDSDSSSHRSCPGACIRGSPTSSWPKPVGTRSLSWSCRAGSRRPNWPAGSACHRPCHWRGASRTASCSASRRSRRTPGGCCSWRRPTRPAIPRSSGAPRLDSGSPTRRSRLAGADLIEIGARVRFHHPLVRSAVYRAAARDERRRVRAALAEATDPQVDPDGHAWHRAAATAGPDESVAGELERAARPCRACAAGVGGGTDEVRGRRARRRALPSRHRGGRRRR
jgi:AAA ATPase domain